MDEHPPQTTKERIGLISAWNELGEGRYLVPIKRRSQSKMFEGYSKRCFR